MLKDDIMDKKIGCGIVTYNPELVRLRENIRAIINQVQEVIIFDNGSHNLSDVKKLCQEIPQITLIHSKENVGIAKALNQIMKKFDEQHYSWVVTLDQDSVSPPNLVQKLRAFIDETVGAVGPSIKDINNPNVLKFNDAEFIECNRIITSGCLTNVNAWKSINGFDELMFIDGVDFYFCDR